MAKNLAQVHDMSLLSCVDDDFLKEASILLREKGKLAGKGLLALHSVYGPTLERALELLEKKCVTILSDPQGKRSVLQVFGSVGTLYTLLPQVNYCPCPAYRYHVVGTRTDITCKHVLAAHLAITLGQCGHRQLSGKELADLLIRNSALARA